MTGSTLTLMIAVITLITFVFLMFSTRPVRKMRDERLQKLTAETEGIITEIDEESFRQMKEEIGNYEITVEVKYTIGDREFRYRGVYPVEKREITEEEILGRKVTVLYDPEDPWECDLSVTAKLGSTESVVILFCIIMSTGLFILWGFMHG